MSGSILSIYTGEKPIEPLTSVQSATLEAGKGIVGDRYYQGTGTFSEKLAGMPDVEITLIEQEEIDAFNRISGKSYTGADFRRNLVTQGVRLNDLVGKEFIAGGVRLRGLRLCEPCAHLSKFLGPDIMELMVRRAGLRAQILGNGDVNVDDPVGV